jgi:hypothetical protein
LLLDARLLALLCALLSERKSSSDKSKRNRPGENSLHHGHLLMASLDAEIEDRAPPRAS